MKLLLRLVFLLVAALRVDAQAPESVSNTILSSALFSGLGDHRDYFQWAWLKPDGSRQLLWSHNTRLGAYSVGSTEDGGSYTYRKLSATTAELVLTSTSGGAGDRFTLTFESSSGGQMVHDNPALYTGTFTLRLAQSGIGPSNLSTRLNLIANGTAIAGFSIPPGGPRLVLLRAIGPSLADYGIATTASGTALACFTGQTAVLPLNLVSWWSQPTATSSFQRLFLLTGAFALSPSRQEECLLVELPPGTHTAHLRATTPGEALIEVYFLP